MWGKCELSVGEVHAALALYCRNVCAWWLQEPCTSIIRSCPRAKFCFLVPVKVNNCSNFQRWLERTQMSMLVKQTSLVSLWSVLFCVRTNKICYWLQLHGVRWGPIRDMYRNRRKSRPEVDRSSGPEVDRSSGRCRLEVAWPVCGVLVVGSVFQWDTHWTR